MRDLYLALLSFALLAPGLAHAMPDGEWNFRVLLDDREIGTHRYSVIERDGERQVESNARFTVKVLFVDAYRYVHEARERWRGDCLESIEARTDVNGRQVSVRGVHDGRGLEVASPEGSTSLPGCVMSFAYWNPAMLRQPKLLNAQTGEHADVRVEPLGREPLLVRDQPVLAERYALHADDFRIDLWYGPGDRWVQLESRTSGGQRLRYLIQ